MKHIVSTALLISTCLAFPAFAGGGTVGQPQTPAPIRTIETYDQCVSDCTTHGWQVYQQCISKPGATDSDCNIKRNEEYGVCTKACDFLYEMEPLILPKAPKVDYAPGGPFYRYPFGDVIYYF